jgi:hypothetical protein
MKLTKKQTKELTEGIAEELERDLDRYLEWQAPEIALDNNAELYNNLALVVLNLCTKRYK